MSQSQPTNTVPSLNVSNNSFLIFKADKPTTFGPMLFFPVLKEKRKKTCKAFFTPFSLSLLFA